ncbi:MAG: geranylgeranyl reductase family protein [Cytophagales bacterium]|nr:geranylgeranyl reductase family protein [Armatimonadota bacterium]
MIFNTASQVTSPPSPQVPSEVYDVIVVGAGPGGATCAWKCAEQHDLRVLLLDRAAQMPRYKPCGGGIPASLARDVPGISEAIAEFSDLTVTKLRHSWRGKDAALAALETTDGSPAAVWMVQRPRFDSYLAGRAVQAGAVLRTGVKISEVLSDADGVTVTSAAGEAFRGRVVVGADGAKGVVGTRAGLRLQKRYGIAREIEIPFAAPDGGLWHPKLEPGAAYLDYGTVPNGYAWIFPKRNCLSVGAGLLLPSEPSPAAEKNLGQVLKEAILTLLASVGLSYPLDSEADAPKLWAHPIPYWTGSEPLATPDGRALLVGDAAGVVQPLFGEGIQYAVRSGYLAAQCIAAGTVARDYTSGIRDFFAAEFDAAARISKIFHRAPLLSYRLAVKNPAGTRLIGRIMAGETSMAHMERRVYERLHVPRALRPK